MQLKKHQQLTWKKKLVEVGKSNLMLDCSADLAMLQKSIIYFCNQFTAQLLSTWAKYKLIWRCNFSCCTYLVLQRFNILFKHCVYWFSWAFIKLNWVVPFVSFSNVWHWKREHTSFSHKQSISERVWRLVFDQLFKTISRFLSSTLLFERKLLLFWSASSSIAILVLTGKIIKWK